MPSWVAVSPTIRVKYSAEQVTNAPSPVDMSSRASPMVRAGPGDGISWASTRRSYFQDRKGRTPITDRGHPATEPALYFDFGPSDSVDSAAMKASCGTSTRPTIFIRFLPSFCFSSSLRLRVMSPP